MDFQAQLSRQLLFLENSCRAYDAGQLDEAIRIALCLRVLFHDSRTSISLLKHLGSKDVSLLSTVETYKKPQFLALPLIRLCIDLGWETVQPTAVPWLEGAPHKKEVPFHVWWKKEHIIEINGGQDVFNRRDLVSAAANKDGGAHVDKALDPTYEKALAGAGISVLPRYVTGERGEKVPTQGIHFASIRQIGFEVLNSPAIRGLSRRDS